MSQNQGGVGGFGSAIFSEEDHVWYGGRDGFTAITERAILLDSAQVDSGNTPTTTLRGGQAVIKRASDGKGVLYDPSTQVIGEVVGILPTNRTMVGVNAVVEDKFEPLFTSGLLLSAQIINLNFWLAGQLLNRGFKFDVEHWNRTGSAYAQQVLAAGRVMTALDHGVQFIATTGTFSMGLPDPVLGMKVRLYGAGVTSIAFSTLNSDIVGDGATNNDSATSGDITGMQAECIDLDGAGTLGWWVTPLSGQTITFA